MSLHDGDEKSSTYHQEMNNPLIFLMLCSVMLLYLIDYTDCSYVNK